MEDLVQITLVTEVLMELTIIVGCLRSLAGFKNMHETQSVASGGNPVLGFLKDYEYNLNLQYVTPKGYPTTVFAVRWWTDSTLVHNSFWNE